MTLVAAYSSLGIPMLVGDLLITDGTSSHLDASGFHDRLARKVELFSKSLVIGWTGHLFVAKSILRDIRRKMPLDGVVDKQWLEDCLTGYGSEDFGEYSVYLVGWLISDENHCFGWNSSYPEEVFYGDPMIGGSGKDIFVEIGEGCDLFGAKLHSTPYNLTAVTNRSVATWMALSNVTDMMSHKGLAGVYRSIGVGHAYEIVCLGDDGFHYIDNLLHFHVVVHFDENAVFKRIELEKIMYKYFVYQDHAVVLTIDTNTNVIDMNIASPPGSLNTDIQKQITDIQKQVSDIVLKSQNTYAHSDYHCCSVRAIAPDFDGNLIPIIIPKDAPGNYPFRINISTSAYDFTFSISELTHKYRAFRLNLGNTGPYKHLLRPNDVHPQFRSNDVYIQLPSDEQHSD